jgi:serine/threonine protein kinase
MLLQPGSRPVPNTPDYVLIRRLGAGAFGEVWHALGPGDLDIALKFIPNVPAHELRSLDAMKGIRHPNLVSIFGAWHEDNHLVLAMELCDRTLLDRLAQALGQNLSGIPLEELLAYISDAANGIDALNAKQVQHRDVKPANLLLSNGGVKVADFGLAKALEQTVASNSGAGTIAYTAPECFKGVLTQQTDQYSLAVTYYHLRTGRPLFQGDQAKVMYAHLQLEPDLSHLPPREAIVLLRALAKEPQKRWPNCLTLADELAGAQRIGGEKTRSESALFALARGIEWFNKAGYDLAIQDFDETTRLYPDKSHSYILRGLALYHKKGFEQVVTNFGEAFQRDPNGFRELIGLFVGDFFDMKTGYGTLGEIIEGKSGPELRGATFLEFARIWRGLPENERKPILEGILKNFTSILNSWESEGRESPGAFRWVMKVLWG